MYQNYNFKIRSYFKLDLDFSVKKCLEPDKPLDLNYSAVNNFINNLVWVHILIIFLALFSIYKSWRYIKKFSTNFMDEKDKRKKLKRVKIL